MANICCSIELEPKTLNQGQLNHAREMAADVAQKMEPKGASASFVEGMGLMLSGVDVKELVNHEVRLTDDEDKEKAQNTVELERPCQCSCQFDNIESPDPHYHNIVKEPVTAPF